MSHIYRLVVPAIFNPNSFEYFLDQLPSPDDLPQSLILLDLGLVSAISPYGIGSLLILYRYTLNLGARLEIDFYDNDSMYRRFQRWGMFEYMPCGYNRKDASSAEEENLSTDIFLKLQLIKSEDDIYKAIEFLRENLQLPQEEFTDLIVVISEITQNILEHSDTEGFLNIGREYHRIRRRNFLHICVADSGLGMGQSLKEKLRHYQDDYLDGFAIYKALYEGISRYDDPGRGNGVIKTRGIVKKYHGKMVIRSGCAKLWGDVPTWQIERFLRKNLRYLPGTQVHITFPISVSPVEPSCALIKKS
ncbi:MAG: hypothetical protein JXD21_02130 [Candidatus Omnitrophica bacterium]|nr:hypothetical protein [Candidatus Omnitrophota bacterium]